MGTKSLRLLGAFFATALLAAACGSNVTTEAAAPADVTASEPSDSAPEVAESTNQATEVGETQAMEDEAMEDEAMEDMDDADASHSHDEDEDETSHSHDDVLEVAAGAPVPAVEIELAETDEPGLFDLAVSLTNFTITEQNLDGEPIDNEGHLHLYLDGERVERFFDINHQVTVPEGEHLVEVEISANNHAPYAIDGVPIRANATVTGAGEVVDSTPDASTAAQSINASFVGGNLELDGDERVEASIGDVVMITVESDVADEIHLHGYDIFADVTPEQAATIVVTADTPGRFEIEFEDSGVFIAELVVS